LSIAAKSSRVGVAVVAKFNFLTYRSAPRT
jgi:hypothetical protein